MSVYFSHWGKPLRVNTKKCNTGVGENKKSPDTEQHQKLHLNMYHGAWDRVSESAGKVKTYMWEQKNTESVITWLRDCHEILDKARHINV